jgi:hypothetical protein
VNMAFPPILLGLASLGFTPCPGKVSNLPL